MDLTTKERDRRHASMRKLMQKNNLDVVIANSDLGDQVSFQRYITNFKSSYGEMGALLYKDEGCDIVMTHPGGVGIAKATSWASEVHYIDVPKAQTGHNNLTPTAGGQISNLVSARKVKRVGVFGMEYFPAGWVEDIRAAIPDVEFVDVFDDMHLLRLVKSKEEQDLIRESCRVSDEAWKRAPEFLIPGRKAYEVMADFEHVVRSYGCEDNFALLMKLPMSQEQLMRFPYSGVPVEKDTLYNLEISPRFLGYYGQQTSIVSTGTIPADVRKAYDAINRARDEGLKIVKAGVDLTEIGQVVYSQLSKDGYQSTPSFGHLVGLELEDHHIDTGGLVLEEGTTFIFHPMVVSHPAVMRADTYLVTKSGCERLTTGSIEPLELKL